MLCVCTFVMSSTLVLLLKAVLSFNIFVMSSSFMLLTKLCCMFADSVTDGGLHSFIVHDAFRF